MSGGSYDYAQYKLDEWAGTLRARHVGEAHVLALATHFERLGRLMHDIEWADSCDTDWDEKLDADIRAFLNPGAEIEEATVLAEAALASLQRALAPPSLSPLGEP